MTYRVNGTLKLPDGSPAANCEIEFVSRKNLSPTVHGSKTNIMTSNTGYYDVTLELGEYAVIIYAGGTYPSQAGVIVVLADTTPGQDLPTLLSNGELLPTTPDYMQQIQAWLVAANESADDSAASAAASEASAQAAAASAATTAAAVTAHEAKPSAHPISGVDGLQAALDGKEAVGVAAAAVTAHKAESNAHEIADITGLYDALASIGGGGGGGGGVFGGQYRNLSVNVSGVGYQGTITAERLVVESEFFVATVLRNLSLSFDAATSGAGGLDTGSVAAGNWYYVYVIYNESTVASLISLSSTAPTLPSGYTKFARVGAARVPAAYTRFLASKQRDNACWYARPDLVVILSGGTSTPVTQISTSAGRPPIAKSVWIRKYATGEGSLTKYPSDLTIDSQSQISVLDIDDTDYQSIWYTAGSGTCEYVVLGYRI